MNKVFTARRALPVVVAAALLVAGCAQRDPNRSGLLQPYRTDLPQGNYLTQATLDQVREGMSREQVRFVLGTPLLRHVFHPDRWDYVFRYQFPNGRAELRRATILFKDDRVVSIDAEALPAKEDPNDPALPGYRPQAAAKTAS
jgi:outer membrane protein assembly factor BamE